jgi:predicted DNA-binding transcriptional regulator YafY
MSSRTETRIARILAMIPYVVERDGATIHDLRERFGYTTDAEVVKDLHLIFLTGLPGYGPGDLIDVDIFEDEVTIDSADYFARPMRLTPTEALGLLAAGSTLIASGQASPELRSAIDKLSHAIGAELDDRVLVDVPTPPTVDLLRTAIEETRLVEITYVALSSNERTTRLVEGESVFFNLGRWYFSGFCRYADADRLFRVDRIDTARVLDELYEPSVADASSIVRYEPSPDDHIVEFTVGEASRWVTEYYPVEASPLPDGGQHVTMRVSDPLVAARLLLRLGSDAALVSGDAVARSLEELRGRVLRRYA